MLDAARDGWHQFPNRCVGTREGCMALIINIKNSRHSPLVQVGRATLKGHLIENVPRITC